jgi:hypothetical protein
MRKNMAKPSKVFSMVYARSLTHASLSTLAVAVTALLCSINISNYAASLENHTRLTYECTLALDNFCLPIDSFQSQQTSTEALLSAAYGFAWLEDHYKFYEKNPILTMMARFFLSFYFKEIQHEYCGHGIKVHSLGGWVNYISITHKPYNLQSICCYTLWDIPERFPQEHTLVALAGMQANTLLSQKIIEQCIMSNSHLSPFMKSLYWMSTLDQLVYSISSLWFPLSHTHDLANIVTKAEFLYGEGTVSLKQLIASSLLELADPFLIATLRGTPLPWVQVGLPGVDALRLIPMAKCILTPYNVIEKRLIVYCDTHYTPLKLILGYGREQKSSIETDLTHQSRPLTKHHTFYAGLDIYHIYKVNQFNFGLSLAVWRQPRLLSREPRYAPIELGGMWLLKCTTRLANHISGFLDIGYKTSGFTLGYPSKATPIVRLGLHWQLP